MFFEGSMQKAKSTQPTIGHIYRRKYFPNIKIQKKSFIWTDNITVCMKTFYFWFKKSATCSYKLENVFLKINKSV